MSSNFKFATLYVYIIALYMNFSIIPLRLYEVAEPAALVNGQDERRINAPPLTVPPVFADGQSRRESPKMASRPFQFLRECVHKFGTFWRCCETLSTAPFCPEVARCGASPAWVFLFGRSFIFQGAAHR